MGIPDKIGAARSVLKDWNHGKIPYFTVPPQDIEPDVAKGGAVVVSSFGAEFDLSKYDDQVLSSLKESDEMDFVQLLNDSKEEVSTVMERSKELANYLTIEDNDDDESMEEEESDDNDPEDNTVSRTKVSQAEDFDFNTM